MKDTDFINNLVGDLKPRPRVSSPNKVFLIWAIVNFVFVSLIIPFTGSMREDWSTDLFTNWQFILEFALGIIVSTVAGYFLFHHAIPSDEQAEGKTKWIPVALLGIFSLVIFMSLFFPAKVPSDEGYRAGCLHQLIGFSIPPLLVLLYHLRRNAPVNLLYVGFLAGVASAAPFATAMHLACAYDPKHILIFHIFPVIVMALVTAAAVNLFLRWWK